MTRVTRATWTPPPHGSTHRLPPEDPDPGQVSIALRGPDGEDLTVEATDLSDHGCGVRVPPGSGLEVAVGSRIPLTVRMERDSGVFRRRARVVSRTDTARYRTYAFRFDPEDDDHDALAKALRASSNRRGAMRVTPDPKTRLRLRLSTTPDNPPIDGTLVDVSETGAAARAPSESDLLKGQDRTTITLLLPGAGVPVRFPAAIVGRHLDMANILYRLRFLQDPRPETAASSRALLVFIMSRQRALLLRCR